MPTTLRVAVTAEGLSGIFQLAITVTESNGSMATRQLPVTPPASPISFPTALAALLPAAGNVSVEIFGLGSDGAKLAHGTSGPITAQAGGVVDVSVALGPWLGPIADLSMAQTGDLAMPMEGDLALLLDQSLGMGGSADLSIPDLGGIPPADLSKGGLMPDLAMADLVIPDSAIPDLALSQIADLTMCPMNQALCNGACTALTTLQNCGGCGTICAQEPNSTPKCAGGKCVLSCSGDWKDCNGTYLDGCEVNVSNDVMNCATCGSQCAAIPNGVQACAQSVCAIASCNGAFKDCNGVYLDGCEVDTGSRVDDCAMCGHQCPAILNGVAGCAASKCGIASCNGTFRNCDGNPQGDCNIDIATNLQNCGGCNMVCKVANGVGACTAGACKIASCIAPFQDCDAMFPNGCEADTSSDVFNCGGCGNACEVACTMGKCVYDYEWAHWKMPNPAGSGLPNPAQYDTSTPDIVLDKVTGLVWQQTVDPSSYTRAAAGMYCSNLALAGGGWRLPSAIEFFSLIDFTQLNPAIDTNAFPKMPLDVFWTKSPVVGVPQNAMLLYVGDGSEGSGAKADAFRVWCVR